MSMHPVNVDADKLALQGMCPVSYHFGPPAKGNSKITSERNGAVYRFGSEEGKRMFDAGVPPTKLRTCIEQCHHELGHSPPCQAPPTVRLTSQARFGSRCPAAATPPPPTPTL